MKKLTKEGYISLLDKVGRIVKFYIQQIPGINPEFYESLEYVDNNEDIYITDREYTYSTLCRYIDRKEETLCLVKDPHKENQYDNKIVYFLTIDFNKRIKVYLNYKQIVNNEYSNEPITFEILESYKRKECGDVYGDGKVISEEEQGCKGRISQEENSVIVEYGKYNYENLTVLYPEEKFESNPTAPTLESLNTKKLSFEMDEEINNASFLALKKSNKKGRQRIR